MEEGDDKYILWVVTCEKVMGSKELTMLYNNKNYKRDYKTGDPPPTSTTECSGYVPADQNVLRAHACELQGTRQRVWGSRRTLIFCGLFDSFACTTDSLIVLHENLHAMEPGCFMLGSLAKSWFSALELENRLL